MAQLVALRDVVDSALETFQIRFDMKLELDGVPSWPDAGEIAFGSSIALTSYYIN